MGRLDRVHTKEELVDESDFDELDELEPIDEFFGELQAGDMDSALRGMHPKAMGQFSARNFAISKNTRRMLEDRLDDFKLKHQINDYDYKI